jgi:hypothetical protein
LALAVALTMVLVALSIAAPASLAVDPYREHPPPKMALMKGDTVIQKGLPSSTCWSYWEESVHYFNSYCADYGYVNKKDAYPQHAVPVPAGSTLHIRLYKPEQPDRLQLDEGLENDPRSLWGWGHPHPYSLRRVQRDGKTYAWDVFFRVNRPERHYYLGIEVLWKHIPGTHTSYGDEGWGFHVRTRA